MKERWGISSPCLSGNGCRKKNWLFSLSRNMHFIQNYSWCYFIPSLLSRASKRARDWQRLVFPSVSLSLRFFCQSKLSTRHTLLWLGNTFFLSPCTSATFLLTRNRHHAASFSEYHRKKGATQIIEWSVKVRDPSLTAAFSRPDWVFRHFTASKFIDQRLLCGLDWNIRSG